MGQATEHMNAVFFTVAGRHYALLQPDAEPHFALVAVRPDGDEVIYAGPSSDLAAEVAKLAASAN
ncbi:MAG TPA: hypothetical protein VFW33_22345 [Gemmataceae bacterium]|nr:hypothetical protein [Gemmataceae bacterium]